jgi:hypothetical protein
VNDLELFGNKFSFRRYPSDKKTFPLSEAYKFLWETVDVHPSVKIRTLMDIISSDPEFYSKALSEPFLPELVENYKSSSFSVSEDVNLDKILFFWNAQNWEYDKREKEINIYLDIVGKDDSEENWALDFIELGKIIDLPVVLDREFSVYYFNARSDKKENREEYYDDLYKFGVREITLIELLKVFVFEITFHGSEEDKKDVLEDINERAEEVKKAIEEGDFEKFKSFDEVKEQLKERLKERNNDDVDGLDEDDFNKMMDD